MFRRLAGCWGVVLLVLSGGVLAWPAGAQDLPVVVGDGHLWLVVERGGADGDAIRVYHQAPGDDPIRLRELASIPGRLRPGGVAAGGARLVLVLENGEVITRTAHQPPMTEGWSYRAGSLPALPEGVSLRALSATGLNAWALVRVETQDALATLEKPDTLADAQAARDRLHLALGLPPGVELHGLGRRNDADPDNAEPDDKPAPGNETGTEADPDDTDTGDEAPDDPDVTEQEPTDDTPAETQGDDPSNANADDPADAQPDAQPGAEPVDDAEPAPEPVELPVYRLVRSGVSGWRVVALPEEFGLPRLAELVFRGPADERPAVVSEAPRGFGRLHVYLPTGDAGWSMTPYTLPTAGAWSASAVSGQVVVATERERSADIVWADVYLLRARRASPIATLGVDTAGLSRWRLVGVEGDAVLFAAPGPRLQGEPPSAALLGGKRVGLDTGREGDLEWFIPAQSTRWQKNADWLIQVAAFAGAMVLMMLFWKRTPRGREVNLPPDIHLVPWPRRLTATLIDLLPGFWITGMVYGLGWDAILLDHWPGTPIPKPPVAMHPGWLVIAITVFHTTAFEFITARSIGKWLTGTYVSDFRGRPAPPGASFVRAVMRVFDLVAWLLLLLPLISPYRQRLGDILAKTLVVMRDAPAEAKKDDDDSP